MVAIDRNPVREVWAKAEAHWLTLSTLSLPKVGRDGTRGSGGLGTLFCLVPQVDFSTSEELSPEAESRAASCSGLTSSQYCGQKKKDSISSPNLPGKNFD